jgi:hypothetical protein
VTLASSAHYKKAIKIIVAMTNDLFFDKVIERPETLAAAYVWMLIIPLKPKKPLG